MNNLRVSTYQEQVLRASKWIDVQALLEVEEMEALFLAISPFFIFQCGAIIPHAPSGELSQNFAKEAFLSHYRNYIEELKSGKLSSTSNYQRLFSSVITAKTNCLYVVPIGEDKQLIRISTPVIQMQGGTIGYSPIDGKFRSMVFGSDNISWGIQFSYPQLFQDPVSQDPVSVNDPAIYPNTKLFRTLQKWMREHTIPTPFVVDGQLTNVPMRLGKKCVPWIKFHSQLINKQISLNLP